MSDDDLTPEARMRKLAGGDAFSELPLAGSFAEVRDDLEPLTASADAEMWSEADSASG